MKSLKVRVEAWRAKVNLLEQTFQREKDSYDEVTERIKAIQEAQQIIQVVASTIQNKAQERVASIVSRCLELVFDNPYEFRIAFEEKRGKTEARLYFQRDELEVDPLTASGGGVVDVAAFALRLSCLMLSIPPKRKVLVLDEPFRFVSREYRSRVRQMIETLSEEMGIQFVMVTHDPVLRIGKVIELG